MPAMFEFNVKMLKYIAKEIYTCKYGTFLCNNQRERLQYKLNEKTVSMWTFINHFASKYTNPYYVAPAPGQPYHRISRIPTASYFDLTVWKGLYLRFSLDNPRYSSRAEDYRDSLMREQRNLNINLTELLVKSE